MAITISKNISHEFIEALRLSMNFGYVAYQDIIRWADEQIASEPSPNQLLFDISECKYARDLDLVFKIYNEGTTSPYASRVLLSFLHNGIKEGTIREKEMARHLYKMSLSNLVMPEQDRNFCYSFDNEFDLVGIAPGFTEEGIAKDLCNYLSVYSDYNLDNYSQWTEIHKRVNRQLEEL